MLCRCLLTTVGSIVLIAGVHCYRSRAVAAPTIITVQVDEMHGATEEQRHAWREMHDQSTRRAAFVRNEAQWIAALRRRELSLREVTDRILYYCLQHYPEHLENVAQAESGRRLEAKIARNVLRWLHMSNVAGDAELLAQLECELAALPYDAAQPASF